MEVVFSILAVFFFVCADLLLIVGLVVLMFWFLGRRPSERRG